MKLSSINDNHFMVLDGCYKDTEFSLLETECVPDVIDAAYYVDIMFISIVINDVKYNTVETCKELLVDFYEQVSSIIKSAIENYVGEQECDH